MFHGGNVPFCSRSKSLSFKRHALRRIHIPRNRTKPLPSRGHDSNTHNNPFRRRQRIRHVHGETTHSLPTFASQRPRADLYSATRAPLAYLSLQRTQRATILQAETGLDKSHACVSALASSRARRLVAVGQNRGSPTESSVDLRDASSRAECTADHRRPGHAGPRNTLDFPSVHLPHSRASAPWSVHASLS